MKKKIITLLLAATPFICFAQWNQIGSQINGEAEGDESAISIDINSAGTILVIGARHNDAAGNNAGHARVYEWNGTDWIQQGSDLDGTTEGNLYGSEVSINETGNVIAIGATQFGATASTPPGFVRVFDWNGTDWIQRGSDFIGSENRDNFGSSISLSADGNKVAIGAPTNSQVAIFSGQTKVYEWNGSDWNQIGDTINGESESDASGSSVFLNEEATKLFIGETAGSADGRIRTFDWDGTNWIEGAEINDTAVGFGIINDISATGTTILAGGMPGPMSQGISKIFEFNGSTWVQKGSDIEGDEGSDFLGFNAGDINDDGTTIILGAVTGGAGYARTLTFDGNEWIQEGDDILGEGDAVQFGRSVTMNANGSIVAVGTRFNTGTNQNAGLVRAFENKTLGTNENSLVSLEVYPNPANDTVTITAVENIDTITVYNVLGQEINTLGFGDRNKVRLDMSAYASGTYFLQVSSQKDSRTIKLLKQ